ncbi:MAG: hypothetical protein GWP06_00295 [Actinobacteria bacterium]|nr:hypothetical protein [Actinomycetota bacterium]
MKLKPGVEITHKCKTYKGEIPDDVFKEIYGGNGDKESKKLLDVKLKKFKFVEEKEEPVKDEPANSSG